MLVDHLFVGSKSWAIAGKADSYDSDLALDALSVWLLPGLVIRWLACHSVP